MAHFRGTIKGARGEASRLGHKRSGLCVEAQSWQGKVSVGLYHDEATGLDMARVWLVPHHGNGSTKELYIGPVSGEALRNFPINLNPTKGEMQEVVLRLTRGKGTARDASSEAR